MIAAGGETAAGARPSPAAGVEGVVLCGGESRRMGADKAALRPAWLGGATLLERALAALDPVASPVRLACGSAPRYAELGRPLLLDVRAGAGPLGGLVAALEALSGEWLCALAVDMPNAGPDVLRALLARARAAGLDACLLETPEGVEPLCAVYRKTCAEPARAALERGERRLVSFHGGLAVGRVASGDVARGGAAAVNLNTPGDWERERARVSRAGREREVEGHA